MTDKVEEEIERCLILYKMEECSRAKTIKKILFIKVGDKSIEELIEGELQGKGRITIGEPKKRPDLIITDD